VKKTSVLLFIFLVILVSSSLFPNYVNSEVELAKAKYLAYLAQQKAKKELAIFEAITKKEGFMRKATDYLRFSEGYKKINEKRQKMIEKLNELRVQNKINTIEYYKTLEESYKLLAMENKQLTAEMEKGFYDSYMYGIEEFMKGSWKDVQFIANELWGKIGEIISPLLEGDFGGFIKNVIMETIDATFKLRFVEFYKDKATVWIANYWWDYYITSNLNKTDTQKLVEDVVNKAKDEIKEKLEESIKEGVKKKLIESGENIAKDEIKKVAEEAGKNFVKNFIEFPSLLVELVEKYYNVYTFIDLFQEAAPNELNYINQIKLVLKELNMLDEDQINNCYRDKVYFLNLRKRLKKNIRPITKINEKLPEIKSKMNIKPVVKSQIDTEIKIAENFVNELQKFKENLDEQVYLSKFDVGPFINLIKQAEYTLRNNVIDYKEFVNYTDDIKSRFNKTIDDWYKLSLEKIEQSNDSFSEKERKKSELKNSYESYKKDFNNQLSGIKKLLENEMNAYQEKIKQMATLIDFRDKVNSLNNESLKRCRSFVNELNERYKFVRNVSFSFYGDIRPDFTNPVELIDFLNFTGVSKSVLNPSSSYFPTLSKWFISELYSIWKDEYDGISKLLSRANDYKDELEELLSENDWRIYYYDGKNLKMYEPVENAMKSFYNLSRIEWLSNRFKNISSKKGYIEKLLAQFEKALVEFQGKLYIFRATIEGRINALNGILEEIKKLMNEVENEYTSSWKDYLVEAVQIIVDLYYGKITPALAQEKIEKLDTQTHVREVIYKQISIRELLKDANSLRYELEKLKDSGFFNLKLRLESYHKKFGESTISSGELADLSKFKEVINETIEKFYSVNKQKESLENKLREFFVNNPWFFTQFVNVPDNNYMKLFNKGNWVKTDYMIDDNLNITLNVTYSIKGFISGYIEEDKALKKANQWFEEKLNEMEGKVSEFLKNPADVQKKNELLNDLDSMNAKFNEIYRNNYSRAGYISFHPVLLDKRLYEKWLELRNNVFNAKIPIQIQVATPKMNLKPIKKIKPKKISRIYFDYERGYPFSIDFSLDNSDLVVGIQNSWYLLNIKRKKYNDLNAQVLLKPFAKASGPFVIMRLPMLYQLENSKYFVFNAESGRIGIWEPDKEPKMFEEESFPIMDRIRIDSFSSDRRYVLISSSINQSKTNIFVYDITNGTIVHRFEGSINSVLRWIPGEDSFAYFDLNDKVLTIYKVNGSKIKELELPKDQSYFNTIAPLPGGKYIIMITERDKTVVLNTETGKLNKLKLKLRKDEFPETVFSSATGPYFGVVFGKHSSSGYKKGVEIYRLK